MRIRNFPFVAMIAMLTVAFHFAMGQVGNAQVQEGRTASKHSEDASEASYQPGDVQTQVSRVYVFVDKTGLGHQHGVEAKLKSSTLVLGATEQAGKLVFDMKSFDADTPAARKFVGLTGTTDAGTRSAVNENMKGADILNVERYPTATFELSAATATGKNSKKGLPIYRLEGKFTLHGTTRPLTILAEAEQTRGWLHVQGSFKIKQTDYGITPFSKAFGAIGVANELRIYGNLFVAPTASISMSEIPARQ
ncbi:YceI family protein [Stieleria sp. JC731]|uniref:YceI family protein n=1 Tax=Pirellulaceae TaxID=2691357 RepID=UPI001E646DE6|nr:YceI family protein [Stieleria sp. JC731]MCC9602116.1 YceI family protein [Stieleria sp. JC731]